MQCRLMSMDPFCGKAQYPTPVDAHHVVAARNGIIKNGKTNEDI